MSNIDRDGDRVKLAKRPTKKRRPWQPRRKGHMIGFAPIPTAFLERPARAFNEFEFALFAAILMLASSSPGKSEHRYTIAKAKTKADLDRKRAKYRLTGQAKRDAFEDEFSARGKVSHNFRGYGHQRFNHHFRNYDRSRYSEPVMVETTARSLLLTAGLAASRSKNYGRALDVVKKLRKPLPIVNWPPLLEDFEAIGRRLRLWVSPAWLPKHGVRLMPLPPPMRKNEQAMWRLVWSLNHHSDTRAKLKAETLVRILGITSHPGRALNRALKGVNDHLEWLGLEKLSEAKFPVRFELDKIRDGTHVRFAAIRHRDNVEDDSAEEEIEPVQRKQQSPDGAMTLLDYFNSLGITA